MLLSLLFILLDSIVCLSNGAIQLSLLACIQRAHLPIHSPLVLFLQLISSLFLVSQQTALVSLISLALTLVEAAKGALMSL